MTPRTQGLLGVTLVFVAMWTTAAVGTALTGVDDLGHSIKTPAVTPVRGEVTGPPRVQPPVRENKASRSRRPGTDANETLNWAALFLCESSNNPRAISPSGKYRGLAQFDASTWRSVGGHGDPANASRAEQTHRAKLLYAARGAQPWPSCGRWLR